MAIDRDMVDRGEVTPHFIGANGGVLVPPSLRINCSTLAEHQNRLRAHEKLTSDEVAALYPQTGLPVTAPGTIPNGQRPDGTMLPPIIPPGTATAARASPPTGLALPGPLPAPWPESSIPPPQPHAEESDE